MNWNEWLDMKELTGINWREGIRMNELTRRNWHRWIEVHEWKYMKWNEWIDMNKSKLLEMNKLKYMNIMNWHECLDMNELKWRTGNEWIAKSGLKPHFLRFCLINFLIMVWLAYESKLVLQSRAPFADLMFQSYRVLRLFIDLMFQKCSGPDSI